MNRNSIAHFSETPVIKTQRCVMDIHHDHKTTCDAGKLYPFFDFEVLPGDTIHIDNSLLCRMSTPLFPVLDNCYLDTFFFYVPNRLVWSHWKEFCGENNISAWDDPNEYFVPHIFAPALHGFDFGSLYDHFGDPVRIPGISVDALLYRSYRLIWNEWFRNQNVQAPKLVSLGDTEVDVSGYAEVLPVNRFRDYFSSCLPAPQKGAAVQIPLDGTIPVYASSSVNPFYSVSEFEANNGFAEPAGHAVEWFTTGGAVGAGGDQYLYGINFQGTSANMFRGPGVVSSVSESPSSSLASPGNLKAYLSLGQGYATVNALRQAFQIQRMLELDARSGSRYVEILRSHFGVVAPDASLQRPEYLGGRRIPLSINQVLQTSSTDDTSPLGQTGAFSKTVDSATIFRKSFTEHGRIIGVFCIRTDRSYQQGIRRSHSRRTRYDFFWPALAHIGEQAVKNKEIYAQGNAEDDEVFGFQEPWSEYRNHPNVVSGAFRQNHPQGSLSAWHYADFYSQRPSLSDTWMQEGMENLNRTLAVQAGDGAVDTQFYIDAYFKITAARPMPLYSVPGLIDHF